MIIQIMLGNRSGDVAYMQRQLLYTAFQNAFEDVRSVHQQFTISFVIDGRQYSVNEIIGTTKGEFRGEPR